MGDLRITPLRTDDAVYFWKEHDDAEVSGIAVTYVDNCLNAGREKFEQQSLRTLYTFDLKPRDMTSSTSLGYRLSQATIEVFRYPKRIIQKPLILLTWMHILTKFAEISRTHPRPDVLRYANRAVQTS